jgi:hypothetical protein
MKAKPVIISAATSKGPGRYRVPGYVFGLLAVTPMVDHDGKKMEGWTITHIPTGCAAIKRLKFRAAVSAAKELSALDWDFRTPVAISPGLYEAVAKLAPFPIASVRDMAGIAGWKAARRKRPQELAV